MYYTHIPCTHKVYIERSMELERKGEGGERRRDKYREIYR